MKNKTIILFSLLITFGCIQAFTLDASVVSITGKVEIQKNGQWVALKKGDKVSQNAVISTGFKSSAVLSFNNTVFTLSPLTRITLEELSETSDKESAQIYLDVGKVKSSVSKTQNKRINYSVRGPVATASVRGTIFTSSASGEFTCEQGGIDVHKTPKSKVGANKNTPSSSESPKDGETNAFTKPSDISPDSPATSIVLTPGQTVSFSENRNEIKTPQVKAIETTTVNATATQSLAAKESIATNSAAASNNEVIIDSSKKTGTVSVTISFQ